ncbi:MAG TPA: aldehyde dehydrogenase family protein, partial [Herminiimonas sp.]|nr:aldehyde dehydrogenase family protein [Herminiimonas sp.]
RISGVVFTGSTQVAQIINRKLAQRTIAEGREIALIAETGGQNTMVVDSSALCEQVVRDVITSAFDSAGQRCSALRVLCLQTDIAEQTLAMLHGAMQELQIGSPDLLATDIGPVIDTEAQRNLQTYIEHARKIGRAVTQLTLPASTAADTFVAPAIIEIDRIADLQREVFGPVLHVLRYRRDDLPQLVADINASGYGLTLGIHSRIDETIAFIVDHARVGNTYVNRNIVGAVVGVQPFGGEGKSGTGPKAGGPLYLKRLQRKSASTPDADLNGEIETLKRPMQPALAALLSWSETDGQQQLAALCRRYANDSLYGTSLQLPGPTGESNTLRFAARGAVLCMAENAATLLNQLAAVFSTGNRAVILTNASLPSDLPAEIRRHIRIAAQHQDCDDLALALYETAMSELLPSLAARDGTIVSTLVTKDQEPIALWRLVVERVVCVNTTAAGGNTGLMVLESRA